MINKLGTDLIALNFYLTYNQVGGYEVDEPIKDLVKLINECKHIQTRQSCSGHSGKQPRFMIEMVCDVIGKGVLEEFYEFLTIYYPDATNLRLAYVRKLDRYLKTLVNGLISEIVIEIPITFTRPTHIQWHKDVYKVWFKWFTKLKVERPELFKE